MNFFSRNSVRVRPRFPEYEGCSGVKNIFAYIFSLLFWIVLLFVFLVTVYTQWFLSNLVCILEQMYPKHYNIPFWFGLIFVFFFFPFTLIVILLGTFIKILKK